MYMWTCSNKNDIYWTFKPHVTFGSTESRAIETHATERHAIEREFECSEVIVTKLQRVHDIYNYTVI